MCTSCSLNYSISRPSARQGPDSRPTWLHLNPVPFQSKKKKKSDQYTPCKAMERRLRYRRHLPVRRAPRKLVAHRWVQARASPWSQSSMYHAVRRRHHTFSPPQFSKTPEPRAFAEADPKDPTQGALQFIELSRLKKRCIFAEIVAWRAGCLWGWRAVVFDMRQTTCVRPSLSRRDHLPVPV